MGKGKRKALDQIVRSDAPKERLPSRPSCGNATHNSGRGTAGSAHSRSRPGTSQPTRDKVIGGHGPSSRWLLAAGDQATPREDGPHGEEAISNGVLGDFEDVDCDRGLGVENEVPAEFGEVHVSEESAESSGDELPDERADGDSEPESVDLPTVRIRSSNTAQTEGRKRQNYASAGKPSSTNNKVSVVR